MCGQAPGQIRQMSGNYQQPAWKCVTISTSENIKDEQECILHELIKGVVKFTQTQQIIYSKTWHIFVESKTIFKLMIGWNYKIDINYIM